MILFILVQALQNLESGTLSLANLEGVYIGWAPTDESPTRVGELEVVIGRTILTFRHATGIGIEQEEIPLEEVNELSANDVTEYLWDREKTKGTGGCRIEGGATLILDPHRRGKRSPALSVYDSMGDLTGLSTKLFTPAQIERGYHGDAFRDIERGAHRPRIVNAFSSLMGRHIVEGSRFPRLRNGGVLVET